MANGELSDFDIMRQRIREREQKRGKEATQQVKGQFASRGLLASGAQIKAQERAQAAVAEQAREERRDVNIAEAEIRRRQQEAQQQREFLRGERLGGQEFQAGQAALQRGFLTQERLGQEAFQRAMQTAQQQFTTSERQALQSFQTKERQGVQQFTTEERLAAEKFAGIQAQAQRDFLGRQSALDRQQQQTFFEANLAEQRAMRVQNQQQFDAEMDFNINSQAINAVNALRTNGFNDVEINNILTTMGMDPGFLNTAQTQQAIRDIDFSPDVNIFSSSFGLPNRNTQSSAPAPATSQQGRRSINPNAGLG